MSPRSIPGREHVFSLLCGLLYPAPRCLQPPGRMPTPLQQRKVPGRRLVGCRAASTHAADAPGAKRAPFSSRKQLSPGFSAEPALESNLALMQPISRWFPVNPGSQQQIKGLIPKSNHFYRSLPRWEDAAGLPPGSVTPSLDPKPPSRGVLTWAQAWWSARREDASTCCWRNTSPNSGANRNGVGGFHVTFE